MVDIAGCKTGANWTTDPLTGEIQIDCHEFLRMIRYHIHWAAKATLRTQRNGSALKRIERRSCGQPPIQQYC
jgi:hypothetical protein